MDYNNMLKADLVAECEKRGLATDGLKADLIARLEADDNKSKSPAKVEGKKKVWNPMLFRYELK